MAPRGLFKYALNYHISLTAHQVAADQELLNMARDYFHFVTKFFEVIKVSAPHIYHSALELSPQSSIIREYYHLFSQGSGQSVVCGLPGSWDQPTAINGDYETFTWSPCGQSFSARTPTSVEVWDAITLEKLSNLSLTECQVATEEWDQDYHPSGILAYSPDGHSLAGCFGSAIAIWDIQTGGVVEEIDVGDIPKSLVWSLDGKTIGAIFSAGVGTWTSVIYDISSQRTTSTDRFLSSVEPYLWPHKNTLQAMVVLGHKGPQAIINILQVQPTPTNNPIESFSIDLKLHDNPSPPTISFSPSTYQISAITYESAFLGTLFAFDIQSSRVLLQEGYFMANCLSPDGCFLVASKITGDIHVWKYTPEQGYFPWRKFLPWGGEYNIPQDYQFSPTSSLVLISRGNFLEVKDLESPATNPPVGGAHHCNVLSADGTYVITALEFGTTITITNLHKNSSQFINTEFGVYGLALTGNILLVEGCYELAGWRLTVEGVMDKILHNRREGDNNQLWAKTMQQDCARFWVNGQIAVVEAFEDLFYYNTDTGEELDSLSVITPSPVSPSWKSIYGHGSGFGDQCSFSYHDFVECDDPSVDDPPAFIPWYKEGWVKCPGGEYQHRFWLPAHLRFEWYNACWLDKVTTLWLDTTSGLAIIKF